MKKILLLLAVMLAALPARTQVISGCEYFFDTDPGIGNGTSISVTSGDSVILTASIPTTGLTNGFHKLFFRVQNIDGVWSFYEGRTFYIQNAVSTDNSQLTRAEYFFDTDPGVGNGTAFTVSTGDSIIITTAVPTVGLANGFHRLYVRAQNTNGKWSLYEGRSFYIQNPPNPNIPLLTAAEYFYDTDPGVGNGSAFTVTAGDSLVITTATPTTALSNGFHRLFVRAKNADGIWSHYEGRGFYKQDAPDDTSLYELTALEYYFDADPGIGNGTALPVTSGDSIDANFTVPQNLADGVHQLVVRAKNSNEKWSHGEGREFRVGPISVPEINANLPTLLQNYPNPFSEGTSIGFNLVRSDEVVISIIDVLGKTVKVIHAGELSPGKHFVSIHKNDLDGGCYFYKMETSDYIATRQMVMVK